MSYPGWESDFREAELEFFDEAADAWPEVLGSTLDELDVDYKTDHPSHIQFLNERLGLDPPLQVSSFDGRIVVAKLREEYVGARVPDERPQD